MQGYAYIIHVQPYADYMRAIFTIELIYTPGLRLSWLVIHE